MGAKMVVDEAHAIGSAVYCAPFIEVDAMGEIDSMGDSGAIVSDAAAVALNRFCTDEVDRRANDRLLTSIRLSCAAATRDWGDGRTDALRRGSGTGGERAGKNEAVHNAG